MAALVIPCFGGPRDGEFKSMNRTPLGYKKFTCRGKLIWLWDTIKVEYLNFDILDQASMLTPEKYDNLHIEEEDHA